MTLPLRAPSLGLTPTSLNSMLRGSATATINAEGSEIHYRLRNGHCVHILRCPYPVSAGSGG